jgi:hypothetical protein
MTTQQPPESPEPPEPPSAESKTSDVPAGPWASDYRTPPPAPLDASPPSSIATAVRLMYVGAGLSGVGIVVNLTQRDEIREQIAENDSSLTEDELDTAVTVGTATSVVFGLIAIGLWIWMARRNEQGQSWARITATVLGGLSIVSLLATLGMGQMTGLGAVFGVVSLVLAAVILYLLYTPQSSQYYRARSPR